MLSRKYKQLDEHDNEKNQGLDENKTEVEGNRYVLFPPLAIFLLSQKE